MLSGRAAKNVSRLGSLRAAGRWGDAAWRWGPVILWMAGIFVFSSLSRPLGPLSDTPYGGPVGRLCHIGEYAGLAALLYRAVRPGQTYAEAAIRSLLVTLAYALTDEVHQSFVPGREFSVLDLLWDGMGAVLALVGCRAWSWARRGAEVVGAGK